MLARPALAGDTAYVYDVHGQVVGVTRPAGETGYVYDLAGNRTQVTGTAGSAMMTAPGPATQSALRSAPASESLPATFSLAAPSLVIPGPGAPPLGAQRFGPRGEVLPTPYPIEPSR